MSAARFRKCMTALCGPKWSAQRAGIVLSDLQGTPVPRETVRDWLRRDAVPLWVWAKLRSEMLRRRDHLGEMIERLPQVL